MVGSVASAMVFTLVWIGPLVALKAPTCLIQGVVYARLLTVYTEECISSLVRLADILGLREITTMDRSMDGPGVDTLTVSHNQYAVVHGVR